MIKKIKPINLRLRETKQQGKTLKELKQYTIDIFGLADKKHEFEFSVTNELFEYYSNDTVSDTKCEVFLTLKKSERHIECNFKIEGITTLLSDRTLLPFKENITVDEYLIFKYSDEDEESTDELIVIKWKTQQLNIGQYIYDYISLSLPVKRLHPSEREDDTDDDDEEGSTLLYTTLDDNDSSETESNEDQITDPRWNTLKNFKKEK